MLKPPVQYTVASDFLRIYREASQTTMSDKADITRIVNLRCSQLPFCPASLILEYKLKGLHRSMDMFGAFYVTIGTAVHEVLQNYLSRMGAFLADYYCTHCGTLYPLSHTHTCCDFPTVYHEVLIDYGGIVGHIDAIFKDRNGDYWILDFKTTSSKSAPSKKHKPGVVYEEQVESYAYLLYKQYNIRVKGVMLVFIPRDNPRTPVVWARELVKIHFNKISARLKGYRQVHRAAVNATTKEEVLALVKENKCQNPYCKYCKLSSVALKALVRRAFNTKHQLPIAALRDQIKEKPEGMITVSRLLPSPYISERIYVPKIIDMGVEDFVKINKRVRSAVSRINKLTEKLEN